MLSPQSHIDFSLIKNDFPIFKEKNRGKPLIYLDSSSTTQKPQAVIDAISHFYRYDYANIHRGIYELSERASDLYENVRQQVKQFINAERAEEIVFVRGTTEAINLIAQSLSRSQNWQAQDEVIISTMEHHSNIVPWYLLKEQLGIEVKAIPINENGAIDLEAYKKLFSARTRLVAICHASNVLGTVNPIAEMAQIAHAHAVPIVVDGAQAAPHMPVDVKELDCDFYVFSGHKLYGPTGIGVLYGKLSYLEQMPPYHGGGGMIETVAFSHITYAKPPHKFEAGTPDIAGVIGLGAAIRYVESINIHAIFKHGQELVSYAEEQLLNAPGIRLIGTAKPKVGVMSFVMDNIHAHDLGTVLDHEGIAVRAGHHCAMPLMDYFKVPATVRVSFGIYNVKQDIDALIAAIDLAKRLFA